MTNLKGKNILLGVTGGIAAYKAVILLRLLKKQGAMVRVMMTRAATEFVTPLTFQAISGLPVHTDLLDPEAEKAMGHIELARWADVIIIAPATANSIARLANGEAQDLLSAVCLASKAIRSIAPSMNHVMWSNPATQQNIQRLQTNGYHVFYPASGEQACGETGEGRMQEPEELLLQISKLFNNKLLTGKTVLLTAGPTHEPIDPVRFIGNHSSGRMGYALAIAAREAGARVILVSGPVNLAAPDKIELTSVTTAEQMYNAVHDTIDEADIFIGVAAVADYRVTQPATEKIKKQAESLNLELVKTPDILASVAALNDPPFTVGFAAETTNLLDYARTKLETKKLDMIIANRVDQQDAGFNSDYNAVTAIWSADQQEFPHMRKTALAQELIKLIANHYQKKI